MRNPLVLFVCTENIARSQIAEALLRGRAGDRLEVASCGLHPGTEVHPLAVRVMAEIGIDISQQKPKSAKQYLGRIPVSHAIFVCSQAEQACPKLWPLPAQRLFWPLDDPAAETGDESRQLEAFREVRDLLSELIDTWLREGGTSSASRRR